MVSNDLTHLHIAVLKPSGKQTSLTTVSACGELLTKHNRAFFSLFPAPKQPAPLYLSPFVQAQDVCQIITGKTGDPADCLNDLPVRFP